MTNKGPKTLRGIGRKLATGDGRKGISLEKHIKETSKSMEEAFSGKKKKQGRKKKK